MKQTLRWKLAKGIRTGQEKLNYHPDATKTSIIWGTHVNPWLIHVNVWQKALQYCKVISLQLIKINEKISKMTED